ncbi:MAG: hypothetical protein Q4C13_06530 [Clostridia bacterium]|nr:hypothetical protein [Clostridia bacterium]
MRSIMEEIAEAERQAEEIRQNAAAEAREAIGFAHADAETVLSELDISEREKLREALIGAERNGEAAAQEILSGMERETAEACARARDRIDEAVTYLIKRVTEAS